MASTLITCANTAARPGAPAVGDTLYQIDTKQIITCSSIGPVVWQEYDSDGVAGDDLAYAGAKAGNPTSDTNYVISVQPDCHYDASKYVELSSSAADLGDAVDSWGDRSGNGNDATQAVSADQPTYVKNHGNFGLQWPDATSLGDLDTNYTPASTPPGHTLVVATNLPIGSSYAGLLSNFGYTNTLYRAGLSLTASLDVSISSVGVATTFYASSPANLAVQYTRVISCVDVSGDQKTFLNLAQSQAGTVAYVQSTINDKLDATYHIGTNGYQSMGATAANGHGAIFYEVLIFQSALSYTSDGTNLTAGNLKIVVDYLMNKYRISTDLIS